MNTVKLGVATKHAVQLLEQVYTDVYHLVTTLDGLMLEEVPVRPMTCCGAWPG